MKKSILFAAAALASATALADSYTVTFKTDADGKGIAVNADVATILSDGADYISSIAAGPEGTATYTFSGSEGASAKVGTTAPHVGNLKFVLSEKGIVKIDSVVATMKAITEGIIPTVNGFEFGTVADSASYTAVIAAEDKVDTLFFSSKEAGQYYLSQFTVFYTATDVFDAAIAHSPIYDEGKLYESLLGPDMIDETKTLSGALKKGIADKYQWVVYGNTSVLDDGTNEVATSNRWISIDPITADSLKADDGTNSFIQVTGLNGQKNSPVLSTSGPKTLTFYVKDAKYIRILGTGSASGSAADGNYMKLVAKASDGSEVLENRSKEGGIYGKSNNMVDSVATALDPTKAYEITVTAAVKDIMFMSAVIWGSSETAGVAPINHKEPSTYAYGEVYLGPDMITKGGTKVKDGSDKFGIVDEYNWIKYINPTSTLADGTAEVQTSNRSTDLDPRTGEKGTFIQVTGTKTNAGVNSPVLSAGNGKYMEFYVKGTKEFTVYGTGSASGDSTNGNYIQVSAYGNNCNTPIVATSTPGHIYGKGTASDFVTVQLYEDEMYRIVVEGAPEVKKDIMLTGIRLASAQDIANKEAHKGTLNMAIENAGFRLELDANGIYTLYGAADVTKVAISGNGASVITDSVGQLITKDMLVVQGLNIDASANKVALFAMAPALNAADSAEYYWKVFDHNDSAIASIDTTYAIAKIDTTWNEAKTEIASIDTTYEISKIDTTYSYTPVMVTRYEEANQECFYGEGFFIGDCKITGLTTSLISDGDALPWALNYLYISNTIAQFDYVSGEPIIAFDTKGKSIKNIGIENSTLYNTKDSCDMYFLRLSNGSNAQPQKVWGKDTDAASWIMMNNTFVNLPSNKNFANNYITNATQDTCIWTGNIFANTSLLQKAIGNNYAAFTAADNAICGGTRSVDSSDSTKYATVDYLMATTFDVAAGTFYPNAASYAAKMGYGDPRWIVEYVSNAGQGVKVTPANGDSIEVNSISMVQLVFANADSISATDSASVAIMVMNADSTYSAVLTFDEIAAKVAGNTFTAEISAEVAKTLVAGDYKIVVKAGSFDCHKYGELEATSEAIDSKFKIYEPVIEGIETIAAQTEDGKMFNLAGQRVNAAKGIVIMNGKKMIIK